MSGTGNTNIHGGDDAWIAKLRLERSATYTVLFLIVLFFAGLAIGFLSGCSAHAVGPGPTEDCPAIWALPREQQEDGACVYYGGANWVWNGESWDKV